MPSYVCKTCDARFAAIPDGAELLTRSGFVYVYRFADGSVHSLRRVPKIVQNVGHSRWHRDKPKLGCTSCFPPPEPVAQTVQVLEAQSEIIVEEVKPITEQPRSEVESFPSTTMAAAFERNF